MTDPINVGGKTITNVFKDGGNLYIDEDGDLTTTDDTHELHLTEAELAIIVQNSDTAGPASLETILEAIDDNATGDVDQIIDQLKKVRTLIKSTESKIADLKQKLAQAETAGDADLVKSLKAQLKTMEGIKTSLTKEAKQMFSDASGLEMSKSKLNTLKSLAKKMNLNFKHNPDGSKSSSSSSSGGAKAAYNPNAQQQGPKAGAWGPQPGFQMGWSTGGPGGGFNFNAYANSIYTDSAILDGFDQVNKNQANQKKMMMLFFYFAKQAMSGDMGAMYRFMQFITYIISKDKAMQNIHMASKLIEMENSSRAALEELLKQPTPDGQDQGASFEFTKVMERTKAHQSSIAMSQKLIAQMMEEMAQVVESLTGSTKAALDANGRILQRLTRG